MTPWQCLFENLFKTPKWQRKVSFLRAKRRATFWNGLGEVTAHRRRNHNVLLTVPKIGGYRDVLQSESPGTAIKQAIGDSSPDSPMQRFHRAVNESLPERR